MVTPDLGKLAAHVTRRRLQLNLSVRRAAQAAQMSKDTWARVESGMPVQPATYDKIEAALGWTVGSCRKIMDGGEPSLLDDLTDVTIVSVPPEELEDHVRQAVQGALVAGTDLSGSKIRHATETALAELRRRGILPPADD